MRPPDRTRVNWPVDASASGSAQVGPGGRHRWAARVQVGQEPARQKAREGYPSHYTSLVKPTQAQSAGLKTVFSELHPKGTQKTTKQIHLGATMVFKNYFHIRQHNCESIDWGNSSIFNMILIQTMIICQKTDASPSVSLPLPVSAADKIGQHRISCTEMQMEGCRINDVPTMAWHCSGY